jgi:hypothetical protein
MRDAQVRWTHPRRGWAHPCLRWGAWSGSRGPARGHSGEPAHRCCRLAQRRYDVRRVSRSTVLNAAKPSQHMLWNRAATPRTPKMGIAPWHAGPVASLEEVKPRFWDPDGGDEAQAPLTAQTIAATSADFGVRLPAEYLALLTVHNGGSVSPEHDAFATDQARNGWAEGYVGLPHLYGLAADGGFGSVQLSDDIHDPDWGPPQGMVLVSSPDHGHTWRSTTARAGRTARRRWPGSTPRASACSSWPRASGPSSRGCGRATASRARSRRPSR